LARKQKAYLLTSFDGFGLNEAIMRAIAEEKHAAPSPNPRANDLDRRIASRRDSSRSDRHQKDGLDVLVVTPGRVIDRCSMRLPTTTTT
jgi:hypothetical protein